MNKPLLTAQFQEALLRPSPNFDQRQHGAKPQFLILHYTGMVDGESAEQLLQSPEAKVSAHYVVRENGDVVQMVAEENRAWHAGESCWRGINDINSHSIGIEIVNAGPIGDFPDFPEMQIAAVVKLCHAIIERHAILGRDVLAHSDIAPHRKIDPGEKFPWDVLHQAGIGHYVKPAPIQGGRFMSLGETGRPVEAFQSMLALYGYKLDINGIYDERTHIVCEAFQRHFRRQKVDGVADVSTIDTLHRLLGTLKTLS